MISFRSKYLGFDDTWLMIPGIPIIAVMMSLMMDKGTAMDMPHMFFAYCLPVGLIFTTIFWVSFRGIMIFFRKKYPSPGQVRIRIPLEIVGVVVAYVAIKMLLSPSIHQLFGAAPHPVNALNMDGASLFGSFMIIAIYEGIYFYNLFQQSEVEKVRLERANAESQLQGLRSHVNPHFLFNSLNTLSQLIREDAVRAERYVQKMSLVYRYILEMRDKKLIPLKEELQFLESYHFLLHERFGDKVRLEISVDAAAREKHIVPLALQLLIENAIKHNVASVEKPLTIEVYGHGQDALIVRNTLQKKKVPVESTGFGLPNIQARYRYYTDKEVEVIATHDSFMVSLPLLKIPEVKKPSV